MNIPDRKWDPVTVGKRLYDLIEKLFPLCRSITGNGVRKTLEILQDDIPLQAHEVPSGTKVFDWVVPREWNIRDAYIKNSHGKRVVDFQKSNLHVLNYSIPVQTTLPLGRLKSHLHTLPEHPEWIPYRTTYYKETWGFCLPHRDLVKLEDDEYEVLIDSTLEDGSLTYGELFVEGESEDEVLITTHVCHPSLCNDNLSGIAVSTMLAQWISDAGTRYSYRFLFLPGTIGAITWLALNEEKTRGIRHGLVLAGLGDAGPVTYKKSRRGDAEIDRAMGQVLKDSGDDHRILDFTPYGYDERQFCSPGFNLPVGRLSRSVYGQYPEYHTSADDLHFVVRASLADSFQKILSLVSVLENNGRYLNLQPRCEPQLGRRGLYRTPGADEMALLWVLNLSDGQHSLLDICALSGMDFATVNAAKDTLFKHDLLALAVEKQVDGSSE
jgi:aminopeptidase-like protein